MMGCPACFISANVVPATTVQTRADRLSKTLKRFLATKELGHFCGFPRFKTPNRWHPIQLRQDADSRAVWLDIDGKHLHVPAKLGKTLTIKLHRPLEGTPYLLPSFPLH
jgi:hypothetical protein